MSIILIGLILLLIIYTSLSFNSYVLICLFTKEIPEHKPFKVGISAIIGLVLSIITFGNGQWTNASGVVIVLYGVFSGLFFGLYKEGKRFKSENSKTLFTRSSEATTYKASFNKVEWLKSTLRLLLFSIIGLIVTYLIFGLIALLIDKTYFFK